MPYTREELQQKDIPEAVAAFRQFIIGAAQKQHVAIEGKSVPELLGQLPRLREVVLKKMVKMYQSLAGQKIDHADRAFFFSQINRRLALTDLPTVQDESGTRNITNAQPDEALRLIADALYDRYQAKDRKGLPSHLERYMQILLNFNKHLPDQMIPVESQEYKDFLKEQYYIHFPFIRERLNERVRDEVSEAAVPAIMAELDAILQVLAPEAKFSTGEKKAPRSTEGLFEDKQAQVIDVNGELQRRKAEEDAEVSRQVADLQKRFGEFTRKHAQEPLTKLIKTFILHLMKQGSAVDGLTKRAFEEVSSELITLYAAEFPREKQAEAISELKKVLQERIRESRTLNEEVRPSRGSLS